MENQPKVHLNTFFDSSHQTLSIDPYILSTLSKVQNLPLFLVMTS